jgi:hypothetical protein
VAVGVVLTPGPIMFAMVENVRTESIAAEPDTCRRLDDSALNTIRGNVHVYNLNPKEIRNQC